MISRSCLSTLFTVALLCACGGSESQNASQSQSASGASPAPAPLTQVELEQGIGPIRDLALGPIDEALASEGEQAFTIKCSACHKIEERYVAPQLGTVLTRRTPEFVMNMMLNATEMVQRHPEVQALLAEFFTPMPVQITDPDEARAILEYLRSAQIASQ